MRISPRRSDIASQRNFFSSARRTRTRAPGKVNPWLVNTVAKITKSCAWELELLEVWVPARTAGTEIAPNAETSASRGIIRHMKIRWPIGRKGYRKIAKQCRGATFTENDPSGFR